MHDFIVTVDTGNNPWAGTVDEVRIQLFGDRGVSNKIPLRAVEDTPDARLSTTPASSPAKFTVGSSSKFKFSAPTVGNISKILVIHGAAEGDVGDSWQVERFVVCDDTLKRAWLFPCDTWLNRNEVELEPVGPVAAGQTAASMRLERHRSNAPKNLALTSALGLLASRFSNNHASNVPAVPEEGLRRVCFELKNDDVTQGNMYLVGAHPALGGWDTAQSFRMSNDTGADGKSPKAWRLDLEIDNTIGSLEYKYLHMDEKNESVMETGKSNSLKLAPISEAPNAHAEESVIHVKDNFAESTDSAEPLTQVTDITAVADQATESRSIGAASSESAESVKAKTPEQVSDKSIPSVVSDGETERLRAENASLQSELKVKNATLEEQNAKLLQAETELQTAMEIVEEERKKQAIALAAVTGNAAEKETLKSQKDELERMVMEDRAQIEEKDGKLRQVEEELQSAAQILKEKLEQEEVQKQSIAELTLKQEENKRLSLRAVELETEVSNRDKILQEKDQKLGMVEEELKKTSETLSVKIGQEEETTRSLAVLGDKQTENENLQTELKTRDGQIEEQSRKLAELDEELKKASSSIGAEQERLAATLVSFGDLEILNKSIQTEKAELQHEISNKDQLTEELNVKLRQAETDLEVLTETEAKKEELERELEERVRKLDEQDEKLRQGQEELKSLMDSLEEEKKQHTAVVSSLQELKEQNEILESRQTELQEGLDASAKLAEEQTTKLNTVSLSKEEETKRLEETLVSLRGLEVEKESLVNEKTELMVKLDDNTKIVEEQVSKLGQYEVELKTKAEELDEEKKQKDSKIAILTQLEAEKEAVISEKTQLQSKLDENSRELEVKGARAGELEEELKATADALVEEKKQIELKSVTLVQLGSEKESVLSEVAQLKQEVEDRDLRLRKVEAELKGATEAMDETEKVQAGKLATLNELTAQAASLESEKAELESELSETKAKLEEQTELHAKSEGELQSMTELMEKSREVQATQLATIEEMEVEKKSLLSDKEELQGQVEQLSQTVEEHSAKVVQTETELKTVAEAVEVERKHKDETIASLSEIKLQNESLLSEKNELNGELEKRSKILEERDVQLREVDEDRKGVHAKLDEERKEKDAKHSTITELQAQTEALLLEKTDLQNKMEQIDQERVVQSQKLQSLETDLKSATESVDVERKDRSLKVASLTEAESENQKLKERMLELEQEVEKRDEQLRLADSEMKTANESLDEELRRQATSLVSLGEMESQVKSLQSKTAELESELEKRNQTMEEQKNKLESNSATDGEEVTDRSVLPSSLKKDEEIERLVAEKSELEDKIKERDQMLEERGMKLRQTEDRLQSSSANVEEDSKKHEGRRALTSLNESDAELSELKKRNEELQRELEQRTKELEAKSDQLRRLDADLKNSIVALDEERKREAKERESLKEFFIRKMKVFHNNRRPQSGSRLSRNR